MSGFHVPPHESLRNEKNFRKDIVSKIEIHNFTRVSRKASTFLEVERRFISMVRDITPHNHSNQLCRVRTRKAADEVLRRRVVPFLMEMNFSTSLIFQVPAPPSLESDKSSEETSAADGNEENKEDGKEAREGSKAAEKEAPLSNEQAVLLYALRSQQTCTDEVCPTRLREQTPDHIRTHTKMHKYTHKRTCTQTRTDMDTATSAPTLRSQRFPAQKCSSIKKVLARG